MRDGCFPVAVPPHVVPAPVQAAFPRRTPLRIQAARIGGVEVPNQKYVEYSLQYIFWHRPHDRQGHPGHHRRGEQAHQGTGPPLTLWLVAAADVGRQLSREVSAVVAAWVEGPPGALEQPVTHT